MRMKFAIAVVLGLGITGLVQAQGGGFGGFGGGPQGLLFFKAVQEDIKLTEEQTTKLKDWGMDFRKKAEEIRKDKGVEFKKGTRPDAEMLEKMAAANAAVTAEAYKQLGEILDKKQVERLKQIDRQRSGVRAFSDPETASALKLSDSQKASVKGIVGDYDKDARELRGGGKGNFGKVDEETQKKLDKLRKEAMDKVTDVLDDTQKKTWKSLTGEPFDLTKLTFQPRKKD